MTSDDGPDWSEVRRLHAERELSLEAIAARFGISRTGLRNRARAEGWPPRARLTRVRRPAGARTDGQARPPADAEASARAGPSAAPGVLNRRALVARLYRALDHELTCIEEQMATTEADAAAAGLSIARPLGGLIRDLDKLTGVDARLKPKGKRKRSAALDDAERLRQQLAERIARLCGEGSGG